MNAMDKSRNGLVDFNDMCPVFEMNLTRSLGKSTVLINYSSTARRSSTVLRLPESQVIVTIVAQDIEREIGTHPKSFTQTKPLTMSGSE
jgi:hypothetical protein